MLCLHGLQDSVVVGLIIVERCRVVPESKGGNRNAFKLSEYKQGRSQENMSTKVVVWGQLSCTHVLFVYSVRECIQWQQLPVAFLSLSSPSAFDGTDMGYSFVANSAREQDEWRTAITTTRWVWSLLLWMWSWTVMSLLQL